MFWRAHIVAGVVDQAKNAAASAVEAASNLASQGAAAATNLANQAAGSDVGQKVQAMSASAVSAASNLAGQAHAQAHAAAPGIVPAPATGDQTTDATSGAVDRGHDLEPTSAADKAKLEKLVANRPDAHELQDKGILKGESSMPDDEARVLDCNGSLMMRKKLSRRSRVCARLKWC